MSTDIITNSNTDDNIGNDNENNANNHNNGNNEVLASVMIWRWSGGTTRLTLLV